MDSMSAVLQEEHHICMFYPEIVSVITSKFDVYMEQIFSLLQKRPHIQNVHVLVFFMAGSCLKNFEDKPEFKKVKIYPLFVNNEFAQYHCV